MAAPPTEPPETPAVTLRAFVALALPPPWTQALAGLIRDLKDHAGKAAVRWVRPDQIHLTLRFLGQVAENQIPRLTLVLGAACAGLRPLTLSLGRPGAFPDRGAPRVLWIGLEGDLNPLHQLQQKVDEATCGFGDHPEDRTFHPHLTLGRIPNPRTDPRGLREALARARLPSLPPWSVEEVCLLRSQLQPDGAHYTVLGRAGLTA